MSRVHADPDDAESVGEIVGVAAREIASPCKSLEAARRFADELGRRNPALLFRAVSFWP